METAVVSGRVDAQVRDRVATVLKLAGLTPGDIIRDVWESIAATGKVPVVEQVVEEPTDPWEAFVAFCDAAPPADDWFINLTDEQMGDMIASKYE